jgi:hypothetical protein
MPPFRNSPGKLLAHSLHSFVIDIFGRTIHRVLTENLTVFLPEAHASQEIVWAAINPGSEWSHLLGSFVVSFTSLVANEEQLWLRRREMCNNHLLAWSWMLRCYRNKELERN